ncbi:MAG: hypothetical protein H7X86_01330 [Gorillibacterium sp.]|nr:hypothetical protein [Gorillibacterium sp.]
MRKVWFATAVFSLLMIIGTAVFTFMVLFGTVVYAATDEDGDFKEMLPMIQHIAPDVSKQKINKTYSDCKSKVNSNGISGMMNGSVDSMMGYKMDGSMKNMMDKGSMHYGSHDMINVSATTLQKLDNVLNKEMTEFKETPNGN